MIINQFPTLNKAYGMCSCHCHRVEGVYHCVPCCYPNFDTLPTFESVSQSGGTNIQDAIDVVAKMFKEIDELELEAMKND